LDFSFAKGEGGVAYGGEFGEAKEVGDVGAVFFRLFVLKWSDGGCMLGCIPKE
jgi:hypothetical protein